jgi:hypothetical protein
MREIASGFAEFTAIIMILIALAVATAGVAQWADTGSTAPDGGGTQAVQVAGLGHQ